MPERREPPAALALHRETPLVIWSNKTGTMENVGSISPSLIPLKTLETAGIQHPYYTGFLSRIDGKYNVVERHLLVQDNGETTPDWSQEKMVDPLINDFRLIQYDAMFGHKHTLDRLFPGLPKPAGV